MLIHFIASKSNIEEEIQYYRKILKAINDNGHNLTTDWVEPAYSRAKGDRDYENMDWDAIYAENMESLAKTDLVIAEVTAKSFAVGFQTAIALQQKKPTLLLQRHGSDSKAFYPATAKDNLLTYKVYDDESIEEILSKFFSENKIDNKDLRFNFFIDRQIYNYLRWASFKTGKTKAEILRELVKHEIDKQE